MPAISDWSAVQRVQPPFCLLDIPVNSTNAVVNIFLSINFVIVMMNILI